MAAGEGGKEGNITWSLTREGGVPSLTVMTLPLFTCKCRELNVASPRADSTSGGNPVKSCIFSTVAVVGATDKAMSTNVAKCVSGGRVAFLLAPPLDETIFS